ncbi:hypothetical protein JAAARDRAFT_77233 [Jaapia argillacea MUCL 33604]|uniref:Actin-like ATPase domain-containing protein n=1 Tax=Jaapia argillacea MUCL 33604 TaxID=933084 RepID=A0A067Q2F6_9AGAM|nr:hypothetical protein JAAARDRAFT_77233 [Jaapia argillacea MUCL 33604]
MNIKLERSNLGAISSRMLNLAPFSASLVDRTHPILRHQAYDSDDLADTKWDIEKKSNEYTLTNFKSGYHVHFPVSPANGDPVDAYSPNYGAALMKWNIRQSSIIGQYTISPALHNALYWDLGDHKGAKLKLRTNHDGNIYWQFFLDRAPTSSQPTTSPRPPTPAAPTNPSSSRAPNDAPKVDKPAHEDKRKVIFSMDVGTMSSMISFLLPGDEIVQVGRWPQSKGKTPVVPSRMTFNPGGQILYGYESQEEGTQVVAHFKRLVQGLWTPDSQQHIIPGISIASVYEHWIRFLFKRAKEVYDEKKRASDPGVDWNERLLVFPIPNGWTSIEETLLRETILAAGCVADKKNISFVAESDAVLHYLIKKGGVDFEDNKELIVCDAGGSTIEVALYQVITANPLKITEKTRAPSSSLDFLSPQPSRPIFMPYTNYNRTSQGIRARSAAGEDQGYDSDGEGGEDPTKPFRDAIATVKSAIDGLAKDNKPRTLVLTGGFCEVEEVHEQLSEYYETKGMVVAILPAQNAVVDGALYLCRGNAVVSHAASFGYGCSVLVPANPQEPGMEGRKALKFPNGSFMEGGWSPIIKYGQLVRDGERSERMFYTKTYGSKNADLSKVEIDLYARGKDGNPDWVFDKDGKFMKGFWPVATIQVDFSDLRGKLEKVERKRGFPFYKLEFEVEILFGSQSLQATVFWGKDGKGKKDASFVPPDDASYQWHRTW